MKSVERKILAGTWYWRSNGKAFMALSRQPSSKVRATRGRFGTFSGSASNKLISGTHSKCRCSQISKCSNASGPTHSSLRWGSSAARSLFNTR
ncbi:hypothetical protein D3C86_1897130 [compost metagenome]